MILSNQVAAVTDGSRGIGRATALLLARLRELTGACGCPRGGCASPSRRVSSRSAA